MKEQAEGRMEVEGQEVEEEGGASASDIVDEEKIAALSAVVSDEDGW